MIEELCSLASGDKLLRESAKSRARKSHDRVFRRPEARRKVLLLCLIEVVGPPVVNVMAESSSDHGEGIKVRVVLLQLTGLLRRRGINSSAACEI